APNAMFFVSFFVSSADGASSETGSRTATLPYRSAFHSPSRAARPASGASDGEFACAESATYRELDFSRLEETVKFHATTSAKTSPNAAVIAAPATPRRRYAKKKMPIP